MRIAIFVAVVAAHIALVWYFLTLWHLATSEDEDPSSMTWVLLAPPQSVPKPAAEAPVPRRSSPAAIAEPQGQAASPSRTDLAEPSKQADLTAPPVGPDWYDQAHAIAEADAQHIIESEDRAARQAGALTAMIKPLPGPYVPGPAFHWDPAPRYRWQRARGGGWVMPLNDHCDIGFFIMIFVGCTIGELPPARGDLFKNMHPPMKYGDWDWRLDTP